MSPRNELLYYENEWAKEEDEKDKIIHASNDRNPFICEFDEYDNCKEKNNVF